jgi:spore coat protein H
MAVPEYQLLMDGHDLKWFSSHRGTDRWFPVRLHVAERPYEAWIGYRGRYSRWFRKPSYELSFQHPGEFLGYNRIHLNATYRDPSLLRARLCLNLFHQMGVPTPRAWHVCLRLNDRRLGLFTAIESVDRSWLARNGYANGPIYYAVGNQGTLGFINQETGKRKRYLAAGYECAEQGEDCFTDLIDLIHAVVLLNEEEFDHQIDGIVDVDRFLRWFIGVEFFAHTDGLVQNYALLRPGQDRWLISPWDCDATLGRLPNGRPQRGNEMPLGTGHENYLAVRLLASRLWRPRYLLLWEHLLADLLSEGRVAHQLDTIFREIRTAGLQDERRRWSDSTFLRQPASIRRFVAERTTRIRSMLAAAASLRPVT